MTAVPFLNLSVCEREPIRISGCIPPHEVLPVLDPDGRTVLKASANAAEAPGLAADAALGRDLAGLLAPGGEALLAALARFGALPRALGAVTLNGSAFAALARRLDGFLVREFERVGPGSESLDGLYPALRGLIEAPRAAPSFDALSRPLVRELRALTGFDRVVVHRFDAAWNGTVVAEDRGEGLPSCFDLRFPASDIPARARDFYPLDRLRIIPDATCDPVPPPPENPVMGGPLDLGQAPLRGVSPVRLSVLPVPLEYMRNMGQASPCRSRCWSRDGSGASSPATAGSRITWPPSAAPPARGDLLAHPAPPGRREDLSHAEPQAHPSRGKQLQRPGTLARRAA